jgi:RNA polymerase sigma-70 factor (ECF subfamily)
MQLTVIYLIFNEGYAATRDGPLVRTDLCAEAIRLGRLVRTLMSPGAPAEATALLALMLLHDARRDARLNASGDLVILEEQDRRRWDQRQIAEALPLVDEAFQGGPGPFAVQAAIAALHCRAARAEDTDWPEILRLYDLLERLQPTPVVSLNRAVAVAMAHGPPRVWRSSMCSPRPAIWMATTCCIPRAPICCAAWDPPRNRRRRTPGPSRWSPMKASAAFSNGGCAK